MLISTVSDSLEKTQEIIRKERERETERGWRERERDNTLAFFAPFNFRPSTLVNSPTRLEYTQTHRVVFNKERNIETLEFV